MNPITKWIIFVSFVFLLSCMKWIPSAGQVMIKDDRIYRYIGMSNGLQQGDDNSSISIRTEPWSREKESVDLESVIPEPITDEANDSPNFTDSSSQTNPVPLQNGLLKEDEPYNNREATDNSMKNEDEPAAELTIAERTGIPDRIFIQMNQISNPEEFLRNFVINDPDNRQSSSQPGSLPNDEHDHHHDDDEGQEEGMHVDALLRGYSSPDPSSPASSSSAEGSSSPSGTSRRVNKRIPAISSPAGCDVEMRTVEIKDPMESNQLYYPWCVRVPRCSGCCPSNRLKCVPTNVSIIEINAVKLHYAKFNEKFKYEGMRTFRLEKHESCRCECVQQSTDCNEHQEYRSDECRCVCRDPEKGVQCLKREDKMWIQDSCSCRCRHKVNCMTGTIFSEDTCKCHASLDQFSLNQFPLIHFHSSIDLEIKKQQDYGKRQGSSDGINPDSQAVESSKGFVIEQPSSSFNQFVLRDHQDNSYSNSNNRLFIIPPSRK